MSHTLGTPTGKRRRPRLGMVDVGSAASVPGIVTGLGKWPFTRVKRRATTFLTVGVRADVDVDADILMSPSWDPGMIG